MASVRTALKTTATSLAVIPGRRVTAPETEPGPILRVEKP
jgi:hypothetical protein